jgi:hypothetical protein
MLSPWASALAPSTACECLAAKQRRQAEIEAIEETKALQTEPAALVGLLLPDEVTLRSIRN